MDIKADYLLLIWGRRGEVLVVEDKHKTGG